MAGVIHKIAIWVENIVNSGTSGVENKFKYLLRFSLQFSAKIHSWLLALVGKVGNTVLQFSFSDNLLFLGGFWKLGEQFPARFYDFNA